MANTVEPEAAAIRLPREAISDLTNLIRLRSKVVALAQKTVDEPPAASIGGFSARAAAKLGLKQVEVSEIATGLWNIKNLQRHLGVDTKSLIETISSSLKLQPLPSWQAENLKGWPEASQAIASALDLVTDDHPLLVSAKTSVLAYTQEHLLTNTRIITDVRPVFDTAGQRILETVIVHTLALHYVNEAQDRTMIALSLDLGDVIELRKQCERAERKAKVVAEALKTLNPVVLPEQIEP
jgi:hypothetical protein